MNRDLLKRVGMLTAATAACTAGVFGALAVNGLRYMRPTTDNWWLLPWVAPAERIEQCVMDFGEGEPRDLVAHDIRQAGIGRQQP